jgi:predicted MPP superfamily phosphohydrolase
MLSFFAVVSTLYAVIHLYLFWRLKAAFGAGPWQYWALALFAVMVSLALARRSHPDNLPGEVISWVSLVWMGCAFIAVTWFVLLDAGFLALRLFDLVSGMHASRFLSPARAMPYLLALVALLSLYALYEARSPRLVRLTVKTAKLPPATDAIRIAALSDVHISSTVGVRSLRRLAALIEKENPDILLSLGDLLDADMRNKTEEAHILRELPARFGKFAVFGNHEAYRGVANSTRFTQDAGFTLLRGQTAEAGGLTIVGVDDPVFGGGDNSTTDAGPLLEKTGHTRFVLLAQHRPSGSERYAGLFDLQISGHTHGGQIWPARYLAARANGHQQGLSELRGPLGGSLLFISNGSGHWGPPMRLFTPPQILIVDLVRQD